MTRIEVNDPFGLIGRLDRRGRVRPPAGTLEEPVMADICSGGPDSPYATIYVTEWGPDWVEGEIVHWPLPWTERALRRLARARWALRRRWWKLRGV